ncbi:MAG TPA: 6-carboxytetrahydropterin synthase [Phycisphaerae bacterium]|nr:6-carboxytetrahydropterin synthase [Phycisphaerae bacterium]
MRLTREIRFSVGESPDLPVTNSWAGWPTATGVRPYLVLRVAVEGRPDERTGYLVNIRDLDRLLRERTIPLVNRLYAATDPPASLTGERLISAIAGDLAPHVPAGARWAGCRVYLTPFLYYQMQGGEMIEVTQSFEFAAAHRLHCADMSEARNYEIFGKCNNPNGHGHNYQLEETVAGRPDPATGHVIPLRQMEEIVNERVINRFDHKHLNQDCPEFRTLNPSVENITRVIWGLLEGQFGAARLARVRVWETAKTYAEYEGSEK